MKSWIIHSLTKCLVLTAALLICMFILPSCTHSKTPEDWFRLSTSGLAGVDSFTFHGQAAVRSEDTGIFDKSFSFSGKVNHHYRLSMQEVTNGKMLSDNSFAASSGGHTIRTAYFLHQHGTWVPLEGNESMKTQTLSRFNPLAQMDTLHRFHGYITEEMGAGRGTKVIRIELPAEEARKWIRDQLEEEMDQLRKQFINRSDEFSKKKRAELEAVWSDGKKELNSMLKQADAQAVFHLTIDSRTILPRKLYTEHRISYTDPAGKRQHEMLLTEVHFGDYR
ncbi:hypothetical protein PASE110613_02485 [Paenibacillus sediminis]|uniref:Vacuolar-type H+-ATPase subunit H n=1 Tax=Paenibacillus sediminis TaxID=664909 RepID=A0ABS4GZ55_9BACL|nr:hypothetical protein [Paenibacillus sediminis]MBP1935544.1 vacuolar-type H+-ATPase subunit H [Paenibacillus sediminis]